MTNENPSVPSAPEDDANDDALPTPDGPSAAVPVAETARVTDDGEPAATSRATDPADAVPVVEGIDATAEADVIVEAAPQEGILGFTLRELLIVGAWLVGFVLSFVPAFGFPFADGVSLWGPDLQWLLPMGVPTVATFLIVLRRFSPEGIRRVGSLGIDQFASVAFSVAAVSWAALLWQQIRLSFATAHPGAGSWAVWLELLLVLGLVVLTVFAPLVPRLRDDFEGRQETLAHRNANPVRPVIARPRPIPQPDSPPAPAAEEAAAPTDDSATGATDAPPQFSSRAHAAGAEPGTSSVDPAGDAYAPAYSRRSAVEDDAVDTRDRADARRHETGTGTDAGTDTDAAQPAEEHDEVMPDALTEVFAPLVETDTDLRLSGEQPGPVPEDDDVEDTRTRAVSTVDEPAASVAQPFWALAPERRPVHDERGSVIFEIGPDAWILVLEDRGGAYVVRHDDGRVGYLHDTTDMTRG